MSSQKITYGEHLRRNREAERRAWERLSEPQKAKAWHARQNWLWKEFLNSPTLLKPEYLLTSCPECTVGIRLPDFHHWPVTAECVCGMVFISDKWLPDPILRVTTVRYSQEPLSGEEMFGNHLSASIIQPDGTTLTRQFLLSEKAEAEQFLNDVAGKHDVNMLIHRRQDSKRPAKMADPQRESHRRPIE